MDALPEATVTDIMATTDFESDLFKFFALLITLGIPAVVTIVGVYRRRFDRSAYRDQTGWHGSEKAPDALEKRSRKTRRARLASSRAKARGGREAP